MQMNFQSATDTGRNTNIRLEWLHNFKPAAQLAQAIYLGNRANPFRIILSEEYRVLPTRPPLFECRITNLQCHVIPHARYPPGVSEACHLISECTACKVCTGSLVCNEQR